MYAYVSGVCMDNVNQTSRLGDRLLCIQGYWWHCEKAMEDGSTKRINETWKKKTVMIPHSDVFYDAYWCLYMEIKSVLVWILQWDWGEMRKPAKPNKAILLIWYNYIIRLIGNMTLYSGHRSFTRILMHTNDNTIQWFQMSWIYILFT